MAISANPHVKLERSLFAIRIKSRFISRKNEQTRRCQPLDFRRMRDRLQDEQGGNAEKAVDEMKQVASRA